MESYSYLGLGTIVNMGHSQTGVDLTYIDPLGLPGDGGDKYAGLDRFGRMIDHRWYKASTATDVDRFQHTYDRNSNRLTRDVTATGAPATLDEAYTYDNLNRLTKVNQGTLAANTVTDALATYSKAWNLDALGNWKSMVEDLDGGGSGAATTQSRTANARNQISSITGLTTPTYDAKGNMTAEETGQKLVYDGWDRLTKVQDSASQNKVTYAYDGLGRRIKRTDHGANLTSTADDVTTNIYYGGESNWQILEERIGSTVKNQYVWSPKYIDAMVLRDRDVTTGGDLGKTGSGLDERLYPTHDANFNITSILDIAGAVVERFRSDPYGNNLTIMNAAWQTVTEMKDWQHFFQGGRRDGISDLYHFRNREYDSVLAVWTRMDPLGYVDGLNMYQMEAGNPNTSLDPLGLQAISLVEDPIIDYPGSMFDYLDPSWRPEDGRHSVANLHINISGIDLCKEGQEGRLQIDIAMATNWSDFVRTARRTGEFIINGRTVPFHDPPASWPDDGPLSMVATLASTSSLPAKPQGPQRGEGWIRVIDLTRRFRPNATTGAMRSGIAQEYEYSWAYECGCNDGEMIAAFQMQIRRTGDDTLNADL